MIHAPWIIREARDTDANPLSGRCLYLECIISALSCLALGDAIYDVTVSVLSIVLLAPHLALYMISVGACLVTEAAAATDLTGSEILIINWIFKP